MSETELTFAEVSTHSSKKDLYLVIHEQVYNASSFVDEHPGGEEVLLDVGGQDASEAFEDVGHSDEAREILEGMKIGSLKRVEGDPPMKGGTDYLANVPGKNTDNASSSSSSSLATSLGIGLYAVMFIGAALAFFGYQYLQKAAEESK